MKMAPVKVIYIISRLTRGGPVNQLLYLAKYLDKEKVELTVLTTSPRKTANTIHDDLRAFGVHIIELNLSKIKSVFFARKRIQKIIDDQKISVAQSFGWRADLFNVGLKRVFRIISVRNNVLLNAQMIHGKIPGTLIGKTHLRTIKKSNLVVACSESLNNYLAKFGIKATTVRNTVDYPFFEDNFNKKPKTHFRQRLGLPDEGLVLLTVNSRLRGKNVELILNAWNKCTKNSKATLLVAGYSENSLIEKYKNIAGAKFIGRVNNFYEYLRAADCFISASLHEGMPNAPLEALALGTPVLLSDIPAHKEIIESITYKTGVLFANNSEEDFLIKLNSIMDDDLTGITENCKTGIKHFFNAEHMAKQYEHIYMNAPNDTH